MEIQFNTVKVWVYYYFFSFFVLVETLHAVSKITTNFRWLYIRGEKNATLLLDIKKDLSDTEFARHPLRFHIAALSLGNKKFAGVFATFNIHKILHPIIGTSHLGAICWGCNPMTCIQLTLAAASAQLCLPKLTLHSSYTSWVPTRTCPSFLGNVERF